MKVLLVGQPNTGKSSLLNALTGARATISNYPGTTVDIPMGWVEMGSSRIYFFIDTPDIYSLTPSGEEEKVTARMILEGDYRCVVQVVDATALERSLVLTLQLAELGVPLILALNFHEEAEAEGIRVDGEALANLLGSPVVFINPIKGEVSSLLDNLEKASAPSYLIRYDDHIEGAIESLLQKMDYGGPLNPRGVAIRILEDPYSRELFKAVFPQEVIDKIQRECRQFHPHLERDIMVTRSGYAFHLAGQVLIFESPKGEKPLPFPDRFIIDNPWGRALFSLFIFLLIFLSLFYLGGWFQRVLGGFLEGLVDDLTPSLAASNPFLGILISNVLLGLAAGISIAVPYVGLFYLFLAFLEDTGLLARFIIALNRLMGHLRLPGKAIIPLLLGLGCTVPALRSTRILSGYGDRLKVALLYLAVPCFSRTAIIMGVVGHYGG